MQNYVDTTELIHLKCHLLLKTDDNYIQGELNKNNYPRRFYNLILKIISWDD